MMIIRLQDDTDELHMKNKCDQLGSITKNVPMMEHNVLSHFSTAA
jgi:hypothetical protein